MKHVLTTGILTVILVISFSTVANAACIPAFTGGDDTIVCSGNTPGSISSGDGNDVITNNGTIGADIFGNDGNDTLINNGTLGDDLNGDDGNDTLINNGTVDDMFGDNGNDLIINNGFVGDEMRGDDGNDRLINNGFVDDDIEGDDGNDIIINNGFVNDDLRGDDGNDLIINNGFVNDDVLGGNGDDYVIMRGIVNGLISGGNGFDILEFEATLCHGSGGESVEQFLNIPNLDPASDSVTFANRSYTWVEFELLLAELSLQFCDGRNETFDAATPLVSYCNIFGGLDIFDVNEIGVDGRITEGVLVMRTTNTETRAALDLAISSGVNQLIATDNDGNQLYALSSNELQIMGPEVHEADKIYTVILSPGICGI